MDTSISNNSRKIFKKGETIAIPYNSERKGYETVDGGLIRINGDDKKQFYIIYLKRKKGDLFESYK